MTDKYDSLQPLTELPEFCTEEGCGKKIETMCYKGTGVCGDLHRKARDKRNGLPDDSLRAF